MKENLNAIGAAFGRSDFLDEQRLKTDHAIAVALTRISRALCAPGQKISFTPKGDNKQAVGIANLLGYDGLFHTDADGNYLLYEPYMEFSDDQTE